MKKETLTVWFRRGDGAEFEVMEGSAAYEQMSGNPSFIVIPGPGFVEETEPAADEKPKGKGKKAADKAADEKPKGKGKKAADKAADETAE